MDMREFNEGVIAEFRANGGQLSGPMQGAPILLLTTTGRRSGTSHTTPLGFLDVEGRIVVAAANGGADVHPDWFHNIEQDQQVTVELPGATISSTGTVTGGRERTELLEALAETLPGMSDHIDATSRDIPVIVLKPQSD